MKFRKKSKRPVQNTGLFSLRAEDGTRTRDLLTTNEVRYRLCHFSKFVSTQDILHEGEPFVKRYFRKIRFTQIIARGPAYVCDLYNILFILDLHSARLCYNAIWWGIIR